MRSLHHWGRILPLKGDWEFNWGNLYSPEKGYPATGQYFPVPGIWREYSPQFTMQGHGTYRIFIHTSPEQRHLGVLVPRLPGVYSVYLNKKLIFANGVNGTDRNSTEFFAHPSTQVYPLTSGSEIELIVNVSNYKGNFLKGGIRNDFLLGDLDTLRKKVKLEDIYETSLITIIFAVGLYHLIFFASYRKDSAPLFFAFFCFLVSFYTFVTSGMQYFLTPELSLDLRIRFEYFCEAMLVPSVYLILRIMYPKQFGQKWMAILMSTMLLFVLSIFVLDEENLIYVYSFFMHVPPFYSLVLMVALGFAWKANETRARTVFLSGIILAVSMMNDVIYGVTEFYFLIPYSFPIALVGFIAFNSYIISLRFTRDLEKAEEFVELQSKYNEQLRLNAEEKAKYATLVDQSLDKGFHSLINQLEAKDGSDKSLGKLKVELNQTLTGVRDILDLMHHQGGKEELVELEMKLFVQKNPNFTHSEIHSVSQFLRIDQCLQIQRIFKDAIRIGSSRSGESKIFWGKEGDSILLRIFMSGPSQPKEDLPDQLETDLKNRAEKLGARFFLLSESSKFEFELRVPPIPV
ncbi:membrane protein [Leptospira langatensis]|uniref:Membrane protein n=2 Tax=Leptospira langatensis TaxID=2484983 RepID=A0A5F1ZV21_9LEPT|nr:7TM-DISM domain-containing protein [Leptospira langatensis]TGJ99036.1 membrane protein [Leptospira langatensis]TGL40773.1 membrane protein [Leptospira langatensis]